MKMKELKNLSHIFVIRMTFLVGMAISWLYRQNNKKVPQKSPPIWSGFWAKNGEVHESALKKHLSLGEVHFLT